MLGGSRVALRSRSRSALQTGALWTALFPLTTMMSPNSGVVRGKSTVLLHCHDTNHGFFCDTIMHEVLIHESDTLMTVGRGRVVHSTCMHDGIDAA